jgi:hypothetical protein
MTKAVKDQVRAKFEKKYHELKLEEWKRKNQR